MNYSFNIHADIGATVLIFLLVLWFFRSFQTCKKSQANNSVPRLIIICVFDLITRLMPLAMTILMLQGKGIFAELYYVIWFVIGLVVCTLIVETIVNSVPFFLRLRTEIKTPAKFMNEADQARQSKET
jgi:hypothetical protein